MKTLRIRKKRRATLARTTIKFTTHFCVSRCEGKVPRKILSSHGSQIVPIEMKMLPWLQSLLMIHIGFCMMKKIIMMTMMIVYQLKWRIVNDH